MNLPQHWWQGTHKLLLACDRGNRPHLTPSRLAMKYKGYLEINLHFIRFEMLVLTRATQRNIPEDGILHHLHFIYFRQLMQKQRRAPACKVEYDLVNNHLCRMSYDESCD
jgi:hypothetical protein